MAEISLKWSRTLGQVAVLAAGLCLAACNKPEPAQPTTQTQGTEPQAAIVPEGATTDPAVPETGPGEGGTAIGGMVNHDQQEGKAATSDANAPTGGDGAAKQTPPAG